MKKLEKQQIVEELKKRFEKANIALLIKNQGLTVEDLTDLRRKLKSAGLEAKVTKNTLARIAVKETKYNVIKDHLVGPTITIWGYGDPVSPAKILSTFLKDQQKAAYITGALGEKILNANELTRLATLPSREELLAKLLGSFKSPTAGFVNVLAGVPRNLLNVLNAIKNTKTN